MIDPFGLSIGIGETLFVLAGALLWDRLLGEPPAAMHPVVWMGKVIDRADRWVPRGSRLRELQLGLAIALLVPVLVATASWLVLLGLSDAPWLRALTGVWLLKSSFALRGLGEAGETVSRALVADDLSAARQALRGLCSRDASALSSEGVAAGAVESIAENASDSVVAPLFFFALLGLPGALAYRAINTADAMIGYRGAYEYLGKAAARLDDLVNYIPARICAALLLLAGTMQGLDGRRGWQVLRRDGGQTQSPNAGRPMAVMAGLLGVRLAKPGHYVLGRELGPASPQSIARAFQVVRKAAYLAALLAAAYLVKSQ